MPSFPGTRFARDFFHCGFSKLPVIVYKEIVRNQLKKRKSLILVCAIVLNALSAYASVSFTGVTITFDFTGYDGTAGPTGWDADGFSSGTGFTENRGNSAGGVGTGGTYAFDLGAGDMALGVQPTATDFTPGYYQLEIVNNSGATVDEWDVSFISYSYNDWDRSNSFNFAYSTDGTTFTDVAAGSFTSVEAMSLSPAWEVGANYSDSIGVSVANGSSLYLRWTGDDVGGAGSRDEFALDDVRIEVIPEPSGVLLCLAGFLCLLRRQR